MNTYHLLHQYYTATVVYSPPNNAELQSTVSRKALRLRSQVTTGKDPKLVVSQMSGLILVAHRPRMLDQLLFFNV